MKIWIEKIEDIELVKIIKHPDWVGSVFINDKYLASGCGDLDLRIFKLK